MARPRLMSVVLSCSMGHTDASRHALRSRHALLWAALPEGLQSTGKPGVRLHRPTQAAALPGVGATGVLTKACFSRCWALKRSACMLQPDVMAYGRDVMGSRIQGGCRSLSGTSVASPVVAGAVCLLASIVPQANRYAPPKTVWRLSGSCLQLAGLACASACPAACQTLWQGAGCDAAIMAAHDLCGKNDIKQTR